MPNFKMTQGLRQQIESAVLTLTGRRKVIYLDSFPFDAERLTDMTHEPETLRMMRLLDKRNVQQPSRSVVELRFDKADWPGLDRNCTVLVDLHKQMLQAERKHTQPHGTKFTFATKDSGHVLEYGVTPNDREAIVAWLNPAVREFRIAEQVTRFVAQVLERCPTSCDLLASMPMLATLVDDKIWRQRLRVPPRTVGTYGSGVRAFMASNPVVARKQPLVESYLLAAQMLAEPEADRSNVDKCVCATIECWEH